MTGFLEIALLLSAPLLLAACGELLLERSGTLHIGVEGTMLLGAFAAFDVGLHGARPGWMLLAGGGAGFVSGTLFAFFAVRRRADPVLVGTAWNLLAYGATAFGYRLLAGATGAMLQVGSITGVLPVLLVLLLPAALHLFLTRTRAGLQVTAAGENPEALRAQGLSVVAVRSWVSLFAGVCAGAAGALLVVTVSPTFVEGVTAGRGFLALAIVVFSRWKPLVLIPSSLLIGGATALQYRLQAGGYGSVPYALFLALPGILALVALAVTKGRGASPKALGTPAP